MCEKSKCSSTGTSTASSTYPVNIIFKCCWKIIIYHTFYVLHICKINKCYQYLIKIDVLSWKPRWTTGTSTLSISIEGSTWFRQAPKIKSTVLHFQFLKHKSKELKNWTGPQSLLDVELMVINLSAFIRKCWILQLACLGNHLFNKVAASNIRKTI